MTGLILIPTDAERQSIESAIRLDCDRWSLKTIGFGVIASAIETTRLLAECRPSQVILAGIAGLYDGERNESLQIGDALWFDRVAVDGIGVGQGDGFRDATDLGWDWFASLAPTGTISCLSPRTEETFDPPPAMLLTVCSGSADMADARRRMRRYPDAIGEEMEAFSVAYACQLAGVPLRIVRGFSNIAGQRDKSQWRIAAALQSVSKQLQRIIGEQDT